MKSYSAKPDQVGGQWHVVDAKGKTLEKLLDKEKVLDCDTAIGQRKGLRLKSTDRRYVVALDPARDAVIIGDREQAHASRLRGRWLELDYH
jgi:tRNA U34 2-thiouridine synthase MnmA/TrmU